MKIVRIIARLNVGGPARHVVWLTKNLSGGEFESVLLTGTVPDGEEDMNYFAAANGVAPVYIPEMSRELSPKDVVSLWKVFRRIWREKPDIIHTHTAKAGTIGRVAGFFYRWLAWRDVKMVHTYHGHVFHSYYGRRKTAFFLFIERSLARLTDRIIAISAQQKAEINERFRVGRDAQFQVVQLGIDLAPFAGAAAKKSILREELGAGADEILVGFVGRLTEIKNIPLLLRAAKIYTGQPETPDSPKLKFVIIGDGHLRADLETEVEKLDLRDVVVFLGNRTDTDVFYAGLDIVALTSLNEGTPLSLIEAMANGKPFVSTIVGGVSDLLGAAEEKNNFKIGERGIGVASGDAQALFDGLMYLAKNEEKRKSFGAKGLEFVRENYSKERLTTDIINLYRNLNQN